MLRQYFCLDLTFIPSGKKHVCIENLINKGEKAWFSIQTMLHKYIYLIYAKTIYT